MASIGVVRRQLTLIRAQLTQMPVFTSGRPDSDDQADRQVAQLDRICDQLRLILRDLKSADHLARVRLENLRKVPMENRFSERQSAEQTARDVAALRTDTEALADLVRDLLDRNGLLSPIQRAKKTMDLLEDLEKHVPAQMKTGTQQATNGAVYAAPTSDGGVPHLESLVPLFTLIYVAIKYWRAKASGKDV